MVRHGDWFNDGCVPDPGAFNDALTALNRVRRKVAHRRPIDDADLLTCREVAHSVLAPIGRAHPGLADDFLVDRWEEQVAEIVAVAMQTVQSPTVPERGTVAERERRAAAVTALETQLTGIERALARIRQLVAPPKRCELHTAAVAALVRWRDGLRQLLTAARRPGLTLAEAEAAQAEYEKALGEVSELRREIERMRVGLPRNDR